MAKGAYVSKKTHQVTLYDDRYYNVGGKKTEWTDEITGEKHVEIEGGKYFPSVTTVLSLKAPNSALKQWMLGLGLNYPAVMEDLAEKGTKVHDLCERILKGEVVRYEKGMEHDGVWKKVCRFHDFCLKMNPEPVFIEGTIYSMKNEYAGTLDNICWINTHENKKRVKLNDKGKALSPKQLDPDENGNDVWIEDPKNERVLAIIDIKSGKTMGLNYEYQLASYWSAVAEMLVDKEIDIPAVPTVGYILLLGVETTKGWRLCQVKEPKAKMDIFKSILSIWHAENESYADKKKQFPSVIDWQPKGANPDQVEPAEEEKK